MSDQLLSRSKTVDYYTVARTGMTFDEEQVRILLEGSDGEAEVIIKTHFQDINGEEMMKGSRLFKDSATGFLLTAKSTIRCRGCFSYWNIRLAHEVGEPEDDNPRPETGDIILDPNTGLPVQQQLRHPESKPRSGFCPECWKVVKRQRMWAAIIGFFLNPFRQREQNPLPVVLPALPVNLAPYAYPTSGHPLPRPYQHGRAPQGGMPLYPPHYQRQVHP